MIYLPTELFLQAYSLPLIAQVRTQKDYFDEYPQQIHVGTDADVFYNRQSGYYAAHYKQASMSLSDAILVLNENEGSIAIFAGEPPAIPDTANINALSPVYTLQNGGTLAVPTGMVFIRFAESVDIASQQTAINQAGYEVAQTLAYAPHTGWLRAKTGKIADALTGMSQLAAIPNVENVEPQMLTERQLR
ncbi:hypothetical protein NIES2111_19480 [Nostoc sp. NIES-2111]|jgi:hypothetical protein|nr:hypothetical protein NIES2111_19480 [Nostoc sp. NIES-2111]